MDVIFHGVRGSTPTADKNFLKYGGSTTCTEILHSDFQMIFDAGTGFQNVSILKDRPTYLIFSHFHYDHIQGLPFNHQIFDPSNKVTISSGLVKADELREVFVRAFQPMYFPIPLAVSYTHLRAHETSLHLVCRLLLEKARDSDLIVWDGMFLNEELLPKKGWGHSSIEQGIDFSEKTACKNLAIAHHAPNRNDEQLNEHSNNLSNDKVFFAYQGLSHSV